MKGRPSSDTVGEINTTARREPDGNTALRRYGCAPGVHCHCRLECAREGPHGVGDRNEGGLLRVNVKKTSVACISLSGKSFFSSLGTTHQAFKWESPLFDK